MSPIRISVQCTVTQEVNNREWQLGEGKLSNRGYRLKRWLHLENVSFNAVTADCRPAGGKKMYCIALVANCKTVKADQCTVYKKPLIYLVSFNPGWHKPAAK